MKTNFQDKFEIIMAKKPIILPLLGLMIFGIGFGSVLSILQVLGTIDSCYLEFIIFPMLKSITVCDNEFLQMNIILTVAYIGVTWLSYYTSQNFYKSMKLGRLIC